MLTRRELLIATMAPAESGKVAFRRNGRLLFEYRYSTARPKPYVHPLCAPDGFEITLESPADHVHHRGVMLAWSDVNGFDFWGETNPGRHGAIVHQRFEKLGKDALTAVNHWIAEGRALIIERQTIRVLRLEATALEWESELRAGSEPVALVAAKHVYNGLGVRFVHSMDRGRVLNANGTAEIQAANGEPARWCAYYTGHAGAIFDHPSNPRHPTPFFVMNEPFGYLSAAPTFREPFRLEPNRPLKLRWAVLALGGVPDRERLERLYRRWVG